MGHFLVVLIAQCRCLLLENVDGFVRVVLGWLRRGVEHLEIFVELGVHLFGLLFGGRGLHCNGFHIGQFIFKLS